MAHQATLTALDRLLGPVGRALNDVAARKLIGIRGDRKTQRRLAVLARKCNEGELSPEERFEYETLVAAGQVVAILQAQARLSLNKAPRRP